MPSFKFQGFSTGSAVALSATQGATTDTASVPSWGEAGSSGMTLALSATRTSGVAPMGALFAADATSPEARAELPYHDIEGVWSFDDPGDFTALSNTPLWGTNWNLGYGPRGAHTFAQPGSYNIAHTAYDGAGQVSEVLSLTVEDPDVVFAGADTAVVSSSNFNGAPSGAAQFSSISAALSHLSGRTNQRLLIRFNETITSKIDINDDNCSRLYIGRFGHSSDADRPLLDKSGHNDDALEIDGNSFTEITVADLRLEGWYDPTSTSQPDNFGAGGSGIKFAKDTRLAHKTVWNCDITNMPNMSINASITDASTPMMNLYVGNCNIVGWGNYGLLTGSGGNWGFAGNTIQQPTGTINGNGKNSGAPYWPDHGPVRITRPVGITVFSNNDLTSFNDWSAGSSSRTMQTLIRWNSGSPDDDGNPNVDRELVIDRLRGEGGRLQIHTGTGQGSVGDNFVVVDRFHVVPSSHDKFAINCPMGGATFRNGIAVIPDTRSGGSTGISEMFSDSSEGDTIHAGAQSRRSEFYSNALVDLRSSANAGNRSGSNSNRAFDAGGYAEVSNSYFGENILFAPNRSNGTTQHAPLDETATANVVYDGERWEGASVDTSRRYGTEVTARFTPRPGSPAIGGATGKVSLLDFDGNLRSSVVASLSRSTLSVGPFEPDLEN